jgi:hypothetical protein
MSCPEASVKPTNLVLEKSTAYKNDTGVKLGKQKIWWVVNKVK